MLPTSPKCSAVCTDFSSKHYDRAGLWFQVGVYHPAGRWCVFGALQYFSVSGDPGVPEMS